MLDVTFVYTFFTSQLSGNLQNKCTTLENHEKTLFWPANTLCITHWLIKIYSRCQTIFYISFPFTFLFFSSVLSLLSLFFIMCFHNFSFFLTLSLSLSLSPPPPFYFIKFIDSLLCFIYHICMILSPFLPSMLSFFVCLFVLVPLSVSLVYAFFFVCLFVCFCV